ncbi:hypothetical protein RRG08_025817 [Elysia crispata]|uniref:Uncharacterized protein n=1 Tax=Elysia crispata TaxID=231223 RepID=A0AAE0Y4G6_9GAST|nr:hypothetical protein RRG08_025817 [Elysia crispata]
MLSRTKISKSGFMSRRNIWRIGGSGLHIGSNTTHGDWDHFLLNKGQAILGTLQPEDRDVMKDLTAAIDVRANTFFALTLGLG